MNRHPRTAHARAASRGVLVRAGAAIVGVVIGRSMAPMPVDPAHGAGSAKRLFKSSNAGH